MLGSVAIDVAIGLIFCYASISIIASAVYEAIASLFKLRARSLLQGVQALLNDQKLAGLAHELYQHALVNPRSDGNTPPGRKPPIIPSYIEPRAFALAFIDVIQKAAAAGQTIEAGIANIAKNDPQLGTMLAGMYKRADQKVELFEAELAGWFDSGMDRVAGGYKRQAQLCTFLIALAIAFFFNVDTFHLFQTLWGHAGAAATVAAAAGVPGDAHAAIKALNELPVGWSAGLRSFEPTALFGWFATATSVLFGGPFWFDLLQRFVSLRGTGTKPAPLPPPSPAAAPVK